MDNGHPHAKRKRGRPSTYTRKVADQIIQRFEAGETLREICRSHGMPPAPTVRHWVLDDVDGFAERYARARDLGIDAIVEDAIDRAKASGRDNVQVQADRLYVDTIKWYACKMAPRRYSDRQTVEHTGPAGGPVQIAAVEMTDDELAAIIAARRAPASADGSGSS